MEASARSARLVREVCRQSPTRHIPEMSPKLVMEGTGNRDNSSLEMGLVETCVRREENRDTSLPSQLRRRVYCIVLRAHPRCNHVGVTHTQALLVPLTTPYIITLWLTSWEN